MNMKISQNFTMAAIFILLMFGGVAQKSLAYLPPPDGGQCTSSSDSSKNTGSCKKNVGSPGDSCVTCGFFDDCNCNGTIQPQ